MYEHHAKWTIRILNEYGTRCHQSVYGDEYSEEEMRGCIDLFGDTES